MRITAIPLAAILVLGAAVFPAAAQPGGAAPPVRTEVAAGDLPSPRLQALRAQVQRGDREAAGRFWTDVEKTGTPLIEPVAGDSRSLLVTFLWRGGDLRTVVLLGSIAGEAPLFRLAGTDLWYRSYRVRRDVRFTYRLAPSRDPVSLEKTDPRYDPQKIRATAQLDPRNPRRYPASNPILSLVELPDAPPQPWAARRPGVPAGNIATARIASVFLFGSRPLAVYTPPGYRYSAGPYPLLIVLDGSAYQGMIPLPAILDNLIAAGRIPPVIAVLVGRLDAPEREWDLGCNPAFSGFLALEVLPWMRQRYPVTADPARTVVAGSSLGGLAAVCAAVAHPERLGTVLSQSGSFSWKPEGAHRSEWVARLLGAERRLPVRFVLDAGLLETWPSAAGSPSLLDANRRVRDVLRAKGYDVRYTEVAGGHGHANWQATLPEELIAALATAPPPRPPAPAAPSRPHPSP